MNPRWNLARPLLRASLCASLVTSGLAAVTGGALTGCGEDTPTLGTPLNTGPDVTTTGRLSLSENAIRARRDGDRLLVTLPLRRTGQGELDVTAEIALRDLDTNLVATGRVEAGLRGDGGEVVVAIDGLDPTVADGQLASYVLHYQVYADSGVLFGRRSLYAAVEKRSIHVLASDTFYDGEVARVRILATEPDSGRALAGARVTLRLGEDADAPVVFEGETDETGTLSAEVAVDEALLGSQTLTVTVESELGVDTIERSVRVSRDERILVTTDKPLYQPGQVIHIRTLSLRRGDLLPAAGQPLVVEVMDGRGNKILRETIETDAYGVAATQLQLARELNMGEFVVRATLGDTVTERTVTVDRYRLPRFAAALTPDAPFYRPGQEAEVLVRADYLFGEPVAGGLLAARVFRSDGSETLIAELDAVLDADGAYRMLVEIPEHFGSSALQAGEAHVRVDATVTDGAGEERDASIVLPVTDSPILLVAFPAHDLIPGEANSFHVLASDPAGRALAVDCEAGAPGAAETAAFATGPDGSATIAVDAGAEADSIALAVSCAAEDGAEAARTFTFDLTSQRSNGAIALTTASSLYRAGDVVDVTVRATPGIDRVFLDVIANNRTLWTESVRLEDGVATAGVTLPQDVAGAIELMAYYVGPDISVVRGRRLVYAEAANDLTVSFTPDRDEYLPGEDARIDVRVTDGDGEPVAASLGVQIVDEAVFALQDMRPGAERIFFQLEQDLLEPRYDVHGHDIGDVVDDASGTTAERDRAAQILFAASAGSPGYGIVVDTLAEVRAAARSIGDQRLRHDVEAAVTDTAERAIARFGNDYSTIYANATVIIDDMAGRYLDPWGQPYLVEALSQWSDNPDSVRFSGTGFDELAGTADDVTTTVWFDTIVYGGVQNGGPFPGDGGGRDDDFAGGGGGEPVAEPGEAEGGGDGGGDAPRVRSYFPETLLVEPSLITGSDGTAAIDVTMADSITTWRVTGMASSRAGQLGSSTAGVRVFQPFFLDIDFPATLTQHDEVAVPVAVFNFLDEAQEIELRVQGASDWYELLSPATQTVRLEAGEVTSVPFRVRVERPGLHTFEVAGVGGDFPDAVRRSVQVMPDGEENVVAVSDRLEGDVDVTIDIPVEAIEEAYGLFVKVYPGLFSQVVEGLDALLAMPSGCFEQTSSTTYPNVLALDYMRRTGQVNQEIEATALTYIQTGYQRLLSYEVTGGGFEWFGNDPAHRILTAYGLLEFSDMSEVYEVDPAVITRTQNWLVSQQEGDGRFRAAPEGIHEGATNNFTDSDVRATAYIAYALAESGFSGSALDRAVAWLDGEVATVEDPYTLALIANLLISRDRSDGSIGTLLARLADAAEEADGVVHWSSDSQSLTYGSGDAMAMETTALVLYAFIRAGAYPDLVDGGVGYLVANKDTFGTWSSTQATILSLRTFIALLDNAAEPTDATIVVRFGDEVVETFAVDEDNSDVVRQVDLSHLAGPGENHVSIELDGEGGLLYQVVGRYYLPWALVPPVEPPIDLDVAYPAGTVGVGEAAGVDVRVANTTGERMEMVMLQLGVPPGFDVVMRGLNEAVAAGVVSRADRTASGVDAYLYGLDPAEALELSFDIVPRMPAAVQAPASVAYLYYDPAVRTETEPTSVVAE